MLLTRGAEIHTKETRAKREKSIVVAQSQLDMGLVARKAEAADLDTSLSQLLSVPSQLVEAAVDAWGKRA